MKVKSHDRASIYSDSLQLTANRRLRCDGDAVCPVVVISAGRILCWRIARRLATSVAKVEPKLRASRRDEAAGVVGGALEPRAGSGRCKKSGRSGPGRAQKFFRPAPGLTIIRRLVTISIVVAFSPLLSMFTAWLAGTSADAVGGSKHAAD